MLPRHATDYTYYRTRDPRKDRRSSAATRSRGEDPHGRLSGELGMLLRLAGVVLVGTALVICIMMAAG